MDIKVKTSKYLTDQPASVHSYATLDNSDSPRNQISPTSLLRKYPHSLRHDQKHRAPIASSESIRSMDNTNAGGGEETGSPSDESASRLLDVCKAFDYVTGSRDSIDEEKSESASDKCAGNDSVFKSKPVNKNECKSVQYFLNRSDSANSPGEDVILRRSRVDGYTEYELRRSKQGDGFKIGSLKKLSVINNSLRDLKTVDKKCRYYNIDKLSESNGEFKSPVHKSTPNLLPSEGIGMQNSATHTGNITDRLSGIEGVKNKDTSQSDFGSDRNPFVRRQSLKGSDSLPQLNQRYRFIHSLLPKLNRPVSESGDKIKKYMKSDTHINSNLLFGASNRNESYQLLSNSVEIFTSRGRNGARSDEESESVFESGNRSGTLVRTRDEQPDVKNRLPRRRPAELMPGLKNLVTRRHRKGTAPGKRERDGISPSVSVPLVNPPPETSKSYGNLHSPVIRSIESYDDGLNIRKSGTMYSLANFGRANSALILHPVKPVNRLRVGPSGLPGSRMCSRCSSLLSMASSSRYSINTAGSGFVPCVATSGIPSEPNMMCKLCLSDVPLSQSIAISQCGCVFCTDCMSQYVENEIQEGAYNISCPDAQCQKQGILTLDECEQLVSTELMQRFMRFRLNHEVYFDKNRTWCPRAGCETVCNICPREKCVPTKVHCPTCEINFCSNCKNPWHENLTCEQNSKKLIREGTANFLDSGIPYDSDLIKCCPMCSVPIEKDEGCAQMMCKKCKHVFCWYCLASLDDDFLLRHYDKGPCKNKLGHSRASVIWHRTQVIGIFAGFGILLLIASPLLLIAAPCVVCCKCRVCSGSKIDSEEDLQADPNP